MTNEAAPPKDVQLIHVGYQPDGGPVFVGVDTDDDGTLTVAIQLRDGVYYLVAEFYERLGHALNG